MDTPHLETTSKFWLDQAVAEILQRYPEGELVVSSGHSPSGNYHVGTLREILTASALAYGLRAAAPQRVVRHLDFVDDLDAFRKLPAGVPAAWEQYLGHPLARVPDPGDCHSDYGNHYLAELNSALYDLGVDTEQYLARDLYPKGAFTAAIEASLERLDAVKVIIERVSWRQLAADWVPVQLLSDAGSWRDWSYDGWDAARQIVKWRDKSGQTGELPYNDGRVKLDRRLDWPARWAVFGVGVEPFGRDHATKGGSYDTGVELVESIFEGKPPYPVPYDFIIAPGQTKKLSKSAGGVITATEALEIMPPEILRFAIMRARPARQLVFDTGLGLFNLIDEYAAVEAAVLAGQPHDYAEAYRVAAAQTDTRVISSVPFGHLVQVYQTAQGKPELALEILARTGYAEAVADQRAVIEREFGFVGQWLTAYAPESVKFTVQPELPQLELTPPQRVFVAKLADRIAGAPAPLDGQGMHEAIYAAAAEAELTPGQAFPALYGLLLKQPRGPRAGWFLSSLDQAWLVARLRGRQ